jgi:hypothetical protein
MTCRAEEFIKLIRQKGMRLSENDKLQIEMLIRRGCKIFSDLGDKYNKFCVTEYNYRKAINDPVTQEEDRKRRWKHD